MQSRTFCDELQSDWGGRIEKSNLLSIGEKIAFLVVFN
jgi:hypothetical protein